MLIARTRHALEEARAALADRHRAPLSLIPTMGALHEGHLSLVAHARRGGARTVASIFVNPTQFGPHEDLARYPRDEEADLAKLREAGCDLVWLPDVDQMYPPGDASFVEVGGPALGWEGELRPGHFRGVATVVTKLFGQTRPDSACFGEKDWQQLQVVRRLAQDLCLAVRIDAVATMREPDGLALSSRNRFLSTAERTRAAALHAGLCEAACELRAGVGGDTACAAARASIQARGLEVEYLALVDGQTMQRIESLQPGARLIGAARLGSVRLLDNIDPR